jgi:hypothetical protein
MKLIKVLLAYIDPVSGVILLQLFIGGCIGVMAGFRHRLWRFTAGRFVKPKTTEDAEETLSIPSTAQPHEQLAPGSPLTIQAESQKRDPSQLQREVRKVA